MCPEQRYHLLQAQLPQAPGSGGRTSLKSPASSTQAWTPPGSPEKPFQRLFPDLIRPYLPQMPSDTFFLCSPCPHLARDARTPESSANPDHQLRASSRPEMYECP